MNIFEVVVEYVKEKELFGEWADMLEIFEKVAVKQPTGLDIVSRSCLGVGGTLPQAVPGVASIGCLQIALLILDDMLDEDPHGIYHDIGPGRAANLASSFQSAGIRALMEEDYPIEVKLAAVKSMNEMMGATALGQELDVQKVENEADYWDVVRKKSSPYCKAALHVGALMGGASLEVSEQVRDLGLVYGELLQIHDDLKDTLATPAGPDWVQWHPALPILFAQVVDHPDRARFMELRDNIEDPDILREAQTILIRCGAFSYCLDQIIHRYNEAMSQLAEIDLVDFPSLEKIFEDMLEPVRQMIAVLAGDDTVDAIIKELAA